MIHKSEKDRLITNEAVKAFAICFVPGIIYVQNVFNSLFPELFAIAILAFLSFGIGGYVAIEKKKSIILYTLVTFIIGLACYHFFVYLPTS